jgi:hypothetical protein
MIELSTLGGLSKWDVVANGIASFVNDSASNGFDAAFALFPATGSACPPMTLDCSGSAYDQPLVPMGQLPGTAAAIVGAIAAMPEGRCTPTEPALRGAEQYCSTFHQQHPKETCVVVLLTDGVPNGCGADAGLLSSVASAAYQLDGTLTFAVGMNVASSNANEIDFDLLNAIAKAGGTDCNPMNPGNEACNIGGGSDLSAALSSIRQRVTVTQTVTETAKIPCQWQIPPSPEGGKIDPKKVNVSFSSAGTTQEIGNVPADADCTSVESGWYYDDPSAPKKIVVCPDTCSAIQAAADARIDISLGCETHKAVLR